MIPELLNFLGSQGDVALVRLLRYLTTRAIFGFMTSFLLCLLLGRTIIQWLYRKGYRDTVRDYGVMPVDDKRGTPTMGGIMIIGTSLLSALLWCELSNRFVQILLLASVWFASLGYLDDRAKIIHRDSDKGLSRGAKYLFQSAFGIILGVIVLTPAISPLPAELAGKLFVPFYKYPLMDLGWLYLVVIVLMVIYSANAINFADGLDGLAIVPTIFVLVVYGIFAYLFGNVTYSSYLLFDYLPGVSEVAIFASALIGGCIGFLWYNAYPAEVFMGDTGSIFLGGVVGTIIVLLKQEVLFFLAGGIFTAEIASVILQDWIGIQRVGRRFMYRAPIHHTVQYRGWSEPKIATRFWIVSGLLAVLSLATLKLR